MSEYKKVQNGSFRKQLRIKKYYGRRENAARMQRRTQEECSATKMLFVCARARILMDYQGKSLDFIMWYLCRESLAENKIVRHLCRESLAQNKIVWHLCRESLAENKIVWHLCRESLAESKIV